MNLFSSKRRIVMVAVVILLALFLVRPGASRLKARIVRSISRAIDRQVEIGGVRLRFLPQPGFDLNDVVIHEDPAFGAEPMLRAGEVTAVVRLASLLRGRLDVARLELTEPSLNLVRRADGHWNWQDLLERTERTPLAPTAKPKSEARPGFPYIAASSGRINFKDGAEKKPYALINADFAFWQDSENTWGARLKAEPLRTDVSMHYAGLIRANGTWKRARSLNETPMEISVEWDRAQLGQVTKLISGNDKGWRGELRLDATLKGIPVAMQVAADAVVQGFHRYDISNVEGLRFAAHCDGRYSSMDAMMHNLLCRAPVGDGMITLHGDAGLPRTHRIDLSLNMDSVPVSSVAALARRAKKNLPDDLVSTGNVQGIFSVKEDEASAGVREYQGRGEVTNLLLRSANTKTEFVAESIPFVLSSGMSARDVSSRRSVKRAAIDGLPAPNQLHLEYGPFPVRLGQPGPAQARGWIARWGYGVEVRGEGGVAHTLRLAGLLGLPAIDSNIDGTAQMDLQIAGSWTGGVSGTSGFLAPAVSGTVQLHNVRAHLRGLNGPIEISSADLLLSPREARLQKLSARAAGASWTGNLALPRGCGTPGACVVNFNLNAEEIGLDGIAAWLSAKSTERRWYQVLTSSSSSNAASFLQNLRASGKLSVRHLRLQNVVADSASAEIELDRGKLRISNLNADMFGGKHRGDWQADFTGAFPIYSGTGNFTGSSLAQIASAMHDPWISGKAGMSYQIAASGANGTTFWQSAEGTVQFEVSDAVLPHISLGSDDSPLRIARGQGQARLLQGSIEIERASLKSPLADYQVSGTASIGRMLNFKLVSDKAVSGGVYTITGTVAEPQVAVTPAAETQAKLKQ